MIEVVLPPSLPASRGAWDLAHALGTQALGRWPAVRGARVRVHQNRHTLIKWAREGDQLRLDLHAAFLPFPDDVLAVVASRDALAWERLSALPREGNAPRLEPSGQVYDLGELLPGEQNLVQGLPPEHVHVGWGRWPAKPPRRSLRLGSCQAGPPRVIRVHPVLDHADVPEWFVGFVLFHELLHLRYPPVAQGARRIVHPRSFQAAERRHPRYAEAMRWEESALGKLLRRAAATVRQRRASRS